MEHKWLVNTGPERLRSDKVPGTFRRAERSREQFDVGAAGDRELASSVRTRHKVVHNGEATECKEQ